MIYDQVADNVAQNELVYIFDQENFYVKGLRIFGNTPVFIEGMYTEVTTALIVPDLTYCQMCAGHVWVYSLIRNMRADVGIADLYIEVGDESSRNYCRNVEPVCIDDYSHKRMREPCMFSTSKQDDCALGNDGMCTDKNDPVTPAHASAKTTTTTHKLASLSQNFAYLVTITLRTMNMEVLTRRNAPMCNEGAVYKQHR